MKLRQFRSGFTLIELLVVISIIAILASFAIPASMGVLEQAKQMQDLNNAKGIYVGLKTWSNDHDGSFPYAAQQDSGSGTPTDASTANDAYANLIPNYIAKELPFYVAKSGWCNRTPPDELLGPGATLSGGENNYCYVNKLGDSSNPSLPLIADAPADASGTYATDPNAPGGVWKGKKAIVVRVDGSVKIELVNLTNHYVMGPVQGRSQNIFTQGAGSTSDPNILPWLTTDNKVLMPMSPTKK